MNALTKSCLRYGRPALAALLVTGALLAAGCGSDTDASRSVYTAPALATVATVPPPPQAPAGIAVDPNLKSKTGTPADADMKALIGLQGKVAYPVLVPTDLPSGLKLDTDLIGSGTSPSDPVGYYSFKYHEPGNDERTITFNQSNSNSNPLSGYYLTKKEVDGTDYQVYWHMTRKYLPEGAPVRTTQIGKAETFIVVWKGSYIDSAGKAHDLYYSLSTGTWTGWEWSDIEAILESMKPLSAVGS